MMRTLLTIVAALLLFAGVAVFEGATGPSWVVAAAPALQSDDSDSDSDDDDDAGNDIFDLIAGNDDDDEDEPTRVCVGADLADNSVTGVGAEVDDAIGPDGSSVTGGVACVTSIIGDDDDDDDDENETFFDPDSD